MSQNLKIILQWFDQIRNLYLKYHLPHPLAILTAPPSKEEFKTMVEKRLVSYWEICLREEAASLTSLKFFRSNYMSLKTPHLIWTTAGSSPAKIRKATIQALMISGRYRTESLVRHWSKTNKTGSCLLSLECSGTLDDIEHILQHCPALDGTRSYLLEYTKFYVAKLDLPLAEIITEYCSPSNPDFCQFLLDCSSLASVIAFAQEFGSSCLSDMFEVSRTWVYALHRDRLRRLNRWIPG